MLASNPFKFSMDDPMGPIYAVIFYVLLVVTVVLAWAARPKSAGLMSPESTKLKWGYLIVWYVCVSADWLQGPYVYALYDAYGFKRNEISQLFVAGFGASMLIGTFAGSLGDRMGRKCSCQLYCVLYILSCMTKHFASYNILMIGRLTGGIATSLLFSGFESWLVSENNSRTNIGKEALGHIFAMMWFGNSLVAILAGIVGDFFVGFGELTKSDLAPNFHYGGYCSPFDLAIVLLAVGMALITFCWPENYGSSEEGETMGPQKNLAVQMKEGTVAIMTGRKLFILMVMVACFEGSMFTFVFNWTPALQNDFTKPAFGMIFATFMMAYMCGASVYDLMRGMGIETMRMGQAAFGLGAFFFLVAGFAHAQGINRPALTAVFLGFVGFEFCCGLYMPSMSTLKGRFVPESIRSTVYNIYRVPMNAIVLVVLLTNVPITAVFIICFVLLSVAAVATTSFETGKGLQNKLEAGETSYGTA